MVEENIMEEVIIKRCGSYDYKEVETAVFSSMEHCSVLKTKEKKTGKALIKVNLLKKNVPEDAVTTHPAVVEAAVRYLQKFGWNVIIGDSPGGPFYKKRLEEIYKASGMAKVAEATGCELNYDVTSVEVKNEKAEKLKSMEIIRVVTEVDLIVSIAKFKTHCMMLYTGAVKNLFGVIPGLTKAEYHFKMHTTENFADHLIDICEYIRPDFTMIDAIEGMEGNGPSSGTRRHVGLLLSAENPYVLDTVGTHIMGMDPLTVPTVQAARRRGLFNGELTDIKIAGNDVETIPVVPFKRPASIKQSLISGIVPHKVEEFFIKALRPKPIFHHAKCISCGDCMRECPAKIIEMKNGKPVADLKKCISCFCCHELCPAKAIDIKVHWLYKILFGAKR
jgi:uncharacterized protein (DUF362 family)/Pyruvate/2-oxoacid:ferredoxin oxidoreductase delta subunit